MKGLFPHHLKEGQTKTKAGLLVKTPTTPKKNNGKEKVF
jgi:hypothetical protein